MKKVINLYKPIGVTPLELIDAFRKKHPEFATVTLGYAGRLDPMADGVLLILVGEENKKRREYERLTKSYTFDVLFSVSTDTYDTLGLITRQAPTVSLATIEKRLPGILSTLQQKTTQVYPPYSSRTVNGKPLYYWARQGRLSEISLPTHQIRIASLTLDHVALLPMRQLHATIRERITRVRGNFRQVEILQEWDRYVTKANYDHPVATLSVSCSSGTYVRSLAHEIGESVGTGGSALRITRERVGIHTRSNALKVW